MPVSVALLAEAAAWYVGDHGLSDFEGSTFGGNDAAARFGGVLHRPFDEPVGAAPGRLQRIGNLAGVNLASPFMAGHRTQVFDYHLFNHHLPPFSSRAVADPGASLTSPSRKSAADVLAAQQGMSDILAGNN
jgi:hypothetical protein